MADKTEISQNEIILQRAAFRVISDPSVVRRTQTGRRLQILSPGRLNRREGPDFLEAAILLDGSVVVGDAEFHRNPAEWEAHGHTGDPRYSDVILHICAVPDANPGDRPFETLILPIGELAIHEEREKRNITLDYDAAEELQHFALIRLLRKTAEAKETIDLNGLNGGFRLILARHLEKYLKGRKRPVYTKEKIGQIITEMPDGPHGAFIEQIADGIESHVHDRIAALLKESRTGEGRGLRTEIMLNCVLPLALAMAKEEGRIELFLWYWSASAPGEYSSLRNRFPNLPQYYLWQQQGMLEFIRHHGKKTNVAAPALKNFGFAETLNFYKTGAIPIAK